MALILTRLSFLMKKSHFANLTSATKDNTQLSGAEGILFEGAPVEGT